MTIRKKLTLWYTGLLTLIIAVFGGAIYGVMRWSMIDTVDTNLKRTAEEVVANTHVVGVGQFGALRTAVVFRSFDVFRVPGFFIQVWQTHERGDPIDPILQHESGLMEFDRAMSRSALDARKPVVRDTYINGIASRIRTVPFYDATGDQTGVIQVATAIDTINQATDQLLAVMLLTSAVAILGAVVLGRWLTNRALKPLDDITQASVKIATTDDLSTRLPWSGPLDELGRLTRVFNHMMDRLQHLFTVEQRFVADVSHELRTPLTAIRGNLEIIKRYGMDTASLDAIDSEVERMSRLVSDLLLLARADYGEISVDLYPMDLDTVMLEVFHQAKVLAKDRDLDIKLDHFVPIRVKGNMDRIKQLLLNLIGNAIKFTPDGGTVTLGLQPRGGWAVIYVKDTGIGMTQEEAEHIFERFYQAEPSRTQTARREGAGLGLSIAQWIVEVHGGKIIVESAPDEGTTFNIKLPILGKVQIKPLEVEEDFLLRLPVIGRPRSPED